jgi:hypothetical protein
MARLGPWRTRPGPIFEAPSATLDERFFTSQDIIQQQQVCKHDAWRCLECHRRRCKPSGVHPQDSRYRSNVLERLIRSRSDSRDSLPVCSSRRFLRSLLLGARLIKRRTKLRLDLVLAESWTVACSRDDLREPHLSKTGSGASTISCFLILQNRVEKRYCSPLLSNSGRWR